MGITMFISLYTTRLILQGLGASDFGIYNIVGGAIAMLGFLNASMASATQRFMNYTEGEGDKNKKVIIFNVSYVLHLAISIFVALLLIVAGYFFFSGILNIPEDRLNAAYIVYMSLIVSTVFTVMSVPYDAVLNSHENMKYYSLVGIIESLLKLFIAFICILCSTDKLIVYGILMACIPIITRIIMRVYCHKKYDECIISIRKYYDKKIMKDMTAFAGWNFLTIASSMLSQYGMGIVLNHFFGTILNAAQGIANQISGVLKTISMNAMRAINPVLVKNEGAQNREKVHYIISIGSRIDYAIFVFFSIPLVIFANEIITLWLDNVPQWAVLFCQLQLIQTIFDKLSGNMHNAVYAQGNIKNYTIIKSIINIFPLIASCIAFTLGCPPYYIYIAWIIFFSIIGGGIIAYYCKKLVGIDLLIYFKQVVLPCLRLTAIPVFAFIGINYIDDGLINCIISIVFFYTTYALLFWYDLLFEKERILLINILKNHLPGNKCSR